MLKAACGRDEAKAKAFADKWGYESVETDWRKLIERKDIDAVDICTPNNTHKEIAIAAAKAGKMILCEKPLSMNTAEGEEMVRGGREGRRAEHGLVQLPPRAGRHARQAAHRRGQARARSSTTGRTSCRTGRSPPTCRRAARASGGSTSAAAGSGVTGDLLAHCIDTAIWLNGVDHERHRDDRDVHQGAQAHPDRQGREGRHRRRLRVLLPLRQRLARRCSNRPATPAATRRCTRFEINGEHASIKWDLHDLHRLQYFDHRDEGNLRGWRSIHVTDGDHPYMKNWWVPGLQIGYEHTFVHQVADFLEALAQGQALPADVPRRAGDAAGLRRGAEEREEQRLRGEGV